MGLRLSVFMTWLYASTRTPLSGRYATSNPLLLLGRRVFLAGDHVLPPSWESDRMTHIWRPQEGSSRLYSTIHHTGHLQ